MKSREEIEKRIKEIKAKLNDSIKPSFVLNGMLQALEWVLSD